MRLLTQMLADEGSVEVANFVTPRALLVVIESEAIFVTLKTRLVAVPVGKSETLRKKLAGRINLNIGDEDKFIICLPFEMLLTSPVTHRQFPSLFLSLAPIQRRLDLLVLPYLSRRRDCVFKSVMVARVP